MVFTEIKDVENYYYFKCTTHRWKGFDQLSRKDKNAKFTLTKEYTLAFEEYFNYKNNITIKNIKNNNKTEKEGEDKFKKKIIMKKSYNKKLINKKSY